VCRDKAEGWETMKRLIIRSRSLLLVLALMVTAGASTSYTAHAVSTAAGIGAAAPRGTAASDSPCTFIPAQTCQSTDPTVTLDIDYTGNTSDCTFTWGVEWGDGGTSANLVVTDPPDGYVQLAQHTYADPGTYSITVLAGVPTGSCTENDFAVQFTLLPAAPTPTPSSSPAPTPPPPPTVTNTPWNGYTTNWKKTPKTFYDVEASWQVPHNKCGPLSLHKNFTSAGQWVGLAGLGNPVIQVGVVSSCQHGLQVNAAVWEVTPPQQNVQLIFHLVFAGNQMAASVEYRGNGQYLLSLDDKTRGWTWSETVSGPDTVPNTADWIVEAGSPPLADFGSVTFTGCFYASSEHGDTLLTSGIDPVKFETKGKKGLETNVSSIEGKGTFTVKYVRS
jgi:hypothetical protein